MIIFAGFGIAYFIGFSTHLFSLDELLTTAGLSFIAGIGVGGIFGMRLALGRSSAN